MELSFFNLKDNPFVHTPEPDRLFRSRSYLQGSQEMAYGIEGGSGLIAIFAQRGMGKTTVVRAYLTQRLQRNVRTIWLTGQSLTFATILDRLCTHCHVAVDDALETTLRGLRSALRREADRGRRVVLLIDEAENLSARVLEDVLGLLEMGDGSGNLLRVILIGEPSLEQRLKQASVRVPEAEGYRRIRLAPLLQRESLAYIQHRVEDVSTDEEAMFTPGAMRQLARYAKGNPGLLNYICNEALRAAVIEQKKPISKPIVRSVLNELEGRQPLSIWRWAAAALVVGLVIAGISISVPRLGRLWQLPKLTPVATEPAGKGKPDWQGAEQAGLETKPIEAAAPAEPKIDVRPPAEAGLENGARHGAALDRDLPKQTRAITPPAKIGDVLENGAEPKTNRLVEVSLLCLTARPPGNHARDIILVDSNGKVQQRLVANGALNLSPILSPDQRHLAYTSYREGSPSIYLRDLESDKDERLTSHAGFALPGAWSPDGRYLALSKSENGNSDIFLYDLKARDMRRLTSDNGIDVSPSFAPDSKRLVFTSSRSGSSQIYLIDVSGAKPDRLTLEGKYNAAPAWSPQGDWIAFIGRSPEQTLELYVIRANGTELRRITVGGSTIEDAPTWSPDGQTILYTRIHNGIRERRIVDLDGRNDRELPGHGQVCHSPQWVAQLTN